MVVYAPAQLITAPAQLITAPAQLINAPAQLINAPAQPPATGAVVYTALFCYDWFIPLIYLTLMYLLSFLYIFF